MQGEAHKGVKGVAGSGDGDKGEGERVCCTERTLQIS